MSSVVLTLAPAQSIGLTVSGAALGLTLAGETTGTLEFAPATNELTLQLTSDELTLQLAPFFKGDQGPAGEAPTTWDYYAANWTTPPAQVGTTAAGAVYSYTLTGVTRHRLVPSPYVAAQDAFYSAWDGAALSGLIVSRG